MSTRDDKELLTFPCHYEYKVFGPAADIFFVQVQAAISAVVPVTRDAMRSRASSGGTYQCVSVLVTLHSREQLEAVYAALRAIDGLKYLL